MRASRIGFATMLVVATVLGCGSDKPYEGNERATVRGKVTLGGKAVETGTISLIAETNGCRNASGSIENGEYAILEANGPNHGTYKVSIKVNEMIPHPSGDEDLTKIKQIAPRKYNEETTLTLVVSEAEVEKNFDLEAK